MIAPADLATLAAAINADPNLTAAVQQQAEQTIAVYYNTVPASPTLVWNPSIPLSTIKKAIDWTADANGFQTLTATKQNAYLAITADGANLDATNVNIRNAFGSIFPATIATALQAAAQTPATRFQALFVSGGSTSYYGYQVSQQDVQSAMGW